MTDQAKALPPASEMTGAIQLNGKADWRGRVHGYLQFEEFAGPVEIDLSRLEDRELVSVRIRGTASYIYTESEQHTISNLIGDLLLKEPDRVKRFLLDSMGEEAADRLLEKLQLSDLANPT